MRFDAMAAQTAIIYEAAYTESQSVLLQKFPWIGLGK